jgi:hypothetical protein
MIIDRNISDILRQWKFEWNKYFLPKIQLERKEYLKCNDVLTSLWLIWNKWKKAHITDEETEWLQETLNEILDIWEVQTIKELRDKYQFFETPYWIAKRMEELLEVRQCDRILEPSAWHGAIASIVDYGTCSLTCVELDPIKCNILRSKLRDKTEIINIDFLEYKTDDLFDRIILNPPFSSNQSIKHILHSYDLLKEWWILVWLVPANFLEKYKDKLENIEIRSFEVEDWQFEHTNISTIIIKIQKEVN